MPEKVEQTLNRIVQDFIWGESKKPKVARDLLWGEIEDGGIKLLDLKARNEAIELVWLKDYLDFTVKRQTWAVLADTLMARAVAAESKHVEESAKINTFAQTWKVSTRSAAGLPEDIKRIVKVAKRYNVVLDTPNPTEDLKGAMPVWYHIAAGEGRDAPNSKSSRCLRRNHKVSTVAQCTRMAGRITRPRTEHRNSAEYPCMECVCDRVDTECDNLARCAAAARKVIGKLLPKWRPDGTRTEDNLTLTRKRLEENEVARAENGRIVFNPTITQGTPLTMAFRVFAGEAVEAGAAGRTPRGFQVAQEETEVYTDRACMKNGLANARARSGVWFGDNDERNAAERVPGQHQSNQTAEIHAVKMAHRRVPPFVPLHIVTD
ncbi:hypothetical protein GY45DRAFT_1258552, partial [Cubamyces sp. BRFM 1775]